MAVVVVFLSAVEQKNRGGRERQSVSERTIEKKKNRDVSVTLSLFPTTIIDSVFDSIRRRRRPRPRPRPLRCRLLFLRK